MGTSVSPCLPARRIRVASFTLGDSNIPSHLFKNVFMFCDIQNSHTLCAGAECELRSPTQAAGAQLAPRGAVSEVCVWRERTLRL